jgi:transcriptional regulator with XRE-family HTH domain
MPVYSNVLSYRALEIGPRIREERKRRAWTLEDLAGRLHISIAALSDIENEKTVLNVERLVDISDALGVPVDALFPRTKTYHFQITRRSAARQRPVTAKIVDQATGAHFSYHNGLQPLADAFIGKHIEPFAIEILPVPDEEVTLINHHHEEFFCVLGGVVECLLETPQGVVRERLTAGDCMYFRSYLPHCIRSAQAGPAHALHVVCFELGAIDAAPGAPESPVIYKKAARQSFTLQVAAKIKALRLARGLSVAEFAGALDLTVRQLAAIEAGRKAVAIDQLVRICSKFGNPLEYFVAGTLQEKPYHFVQRADDISRLPLRTRRGASRTNGQAPEIFKSLAGGFGLRRMYPYHVTLPDPGSGPIHLHEHHGQEFIYVLKGQVKLLTVLDGSQCAETLSPGDACFIDSTVPHQFVSANLNPFDADATADVIDVFWCPLGEGYLFLDDR